MVTHGKGGRHHSGNLALLMAGCLIRLSVRARSAAVGIVGCHAWEAVVDAPGPLFPGLPWQPLFGAIRGGFVGPF